MLAATVGLAGLACSRPDPVSAPSAPPVDLVVENVRLVGSGDEVTISIDGGRIVSVGPQGAPRAQRRIDGRGLHAMPGLFDAHVHLGSGGIEPRSPSATDDALDRLLYYGVTSAFVVGGSGCDDASAGALKSRQGAPRTFVTGSQLTVQGSHPVATIFAPLVPEGVPPEAVDWRPFGVELVRDDSEARAAVRRKAAAGFDGVKIVVESGPEPFGGGRPRMPDAVVQAVGDEARRRGLPLFVHATDGSEMAIAMAAGPRALMHTPAEPPFPDDAAIDELARSGAYVVSTLAAFDGFFRFIDRPELLDDPFLRSGTSAETIASLSHPGFQAGHRGTADAMRKEMPTILATVARLRRRGVRIAAGTDTNNPYAFPGHAMHRELELLVAAGMTPAEAIEAGTRAPAEMLGVSSQQGAIAPGQRADVVLLTADPAADIRNSRRIDVVIAGGRVVDRAELARRLGGAGE